MIEFHAASLAATHALAGQIARLAQPGDTIVLAGEMGTGKTAFAQGFGSALGVAEPITSPTFTLVHSYDAGKLTLHHADLYRLDRLAEVADLALDELAERRAVVLVEWGDVAAAMFPDRLEVRLSHVDDDVDARVIRIIAVGRRWSTRWPALLEAVKRC